MPFPRAVFLRAIRVALTVVALLGARVVSATPVDAHSPHLVLAGERRIEPGKRVELQWASADSVRELEILISLDGGRRYTRCISPRLDPATRHFTWQVPQSLAGEIRLRIRYNRGGREIEGPPTRLLASATVDAALPLGLPVPPAPDDTSRDRAGVRGAPASLAERDDASPRGVARAIVRVPFAETPDRPHPPAPHLEPRRAFSPLRI